MLLHAAGSSPRALDRLGRALAPDIGRFAAPDLQRRGRSLIGTGPAPFQAAVGLATDLAAGGGDAAFRLLVGHSMGGLVTLLALAGGAAVDAAVLYEPIALSLLDPADAGDRAALEWDRACIDRFRALVASGAPETGVAGFIEAYGETPWSALPAPARADLVARAADLLGEAEATNAARLEPDALRRIGVPVLVLDGSRSPDVTRRMAKRLAGLVPRARLETIEGAGHMAPVTSPKAVAQTIAGFLGRLGRTRVAAG